MAYLEELLPEFRKGAKIRCDYWDEGKYIQLKEDGYIYDDKDDRMELSSLTIFGKSWELYKEPELDWDYIIKNKCLCWFWDEHDEEMKKAGILAYYDYHNNLFKRYIGDKCAVHWFDHCRPVRKDEVTFYEDKKDEI